MADKPNILIAVTAHEGTVTTECLKSIAQLVAAISGRVEYRLIITTNADIVYARNLSAAAMMADAPTTHLLFVDRDNGFPPRAIIKMLEADKPVIGCLSPRRSIDLKMALDLARAGATDSQAISSAIGFATRAAPGSFEDVLEVSEIGMGITLLRRDAFLAIDRISPRISTAHVSDKVRNQILPAEMKGYFCQVKALSEDLSFCERWKSTGGKIYALVDSDVTHTGAFTFKANYFDLMEILPKQSR